MMPAMDPVALNEMLRLDSWMQAAVKRSTSFGRSSLPAMLKRYISVRPRSNARGVGLHRMEAKGYDQGDARAGAGLSVGGENERVAVRALGRSKRNEFTETLQTHGVSGNGFAQCTDAVYKEVLGGAAWQLRAKRGLPKRANLRDYIDTNDLSYVMAAEVLSTDRIKDEDRQGNYDCADASRRSAGFIREAIERDKKDRRKR